MLSPLNNALDYSEKNRQRFQNALIELLRIPSVSTSPDHASDMAVAAQWLIKKLETLRFTTQLYPTARHPIVYAEELSAGSNRPTVLIYGHYDVQPAEPLDLWVSPAFMPTVREENLYARGASDMKGQVMATLAAVESLLAAGSLPINIKFVLEGEEEIGSPNLAPFLREHKNLLSCDFALNPDSGMVAADIPTIIYALRGLAYFELRVHGPTHDLHSGVFGGVVHNPAVALCQLLAGMHDENNKVTLPGFYDQVAELSDTEKASLQTLPTTEAYYLSQTGAPGLWGENGYSPIERVGARPTLDINGIYSGFVGSGSKTVIPAWAMAKISMRLVPNQDPEEVKSQLIAYLNQNAPSTIRWELITMSGGKACLTETNTKASRAMQAALKAVWGKEPVFKREGGSVPVVLEMQNILNIQSVLTGFSLPDDNLHAPNEKLHLPTWYQGINALIHFFYLIGEDSPDAS